MRQLKLMLALLFVGLGFLSFMNDASEASVGLEIGDKAPDFDTQNLEGSFVKLNDYKGKMIILNFWASYDAPSRMNNFQLNRILNLYQDRHFHNGTDLAIISVSLDRFKSPLNKAIEQDETAFFNHICDYLGVDGKVAKTYGISEPVNILIDGEGKILIKDKQVEKLEKSLAFLAAK